MKEIYNYLYYRIYEWQLRLHGKENLPEYLASIGVSLFISLQIAIFFYMMNDILLYFSFIHKIIVIPQILIIIFMLLIIFIGLFIFIPKRKYLKFIIKYRNDDIKTKKRNFLKLKITISIHIFLLIFFIVIARYLYIINGL
ncbi:MAG: hypothetical protein GXO80_03750 [Chlorobi bacterium]|nr:hypothetical protein [Chlorobiota bacterium]